MKQAPPARPFELRKARCAQETAKEVSASSHQNPVQGWCPPVPVFRRLGVRTREEIDRERYALKALRGDFRGVGDGADAAAHAGNALEAVNR